tara:strand:+ start:420 stop:701 length:282 start_codon:yes stop_codon:yes gene_type:complete
MKKQNTGSTFEDFLNDEGIAEEVNALAVKRVIAWQMLEVMKKDKITKKTMAERLHTSRSQLDRVLDPENSTVQLDTLVKVADAIGRKLRIELV